MHLGFSNVFTNESASKLSSQMVKLFLIALLFSVTPDSAFAIGGLNKATSALTEVRTWAYTFGGVAIAVWAIFATIKVASGGADWKQEFSKPAIALIALISITEIVNYFMHK